MTEETKHIIWANAYALKRDKLGRYSILAVRYANEILEEAESHFSRTDGPHKPIRDSEVDLTSREDKVCGNSTHWWGNGVCEICEDKTRGVIDGN